MKTKKKITKAELQVLRLIREGNTSLSIADELNCSVRTIEKHRSNIIKKLDVPRGTRLQLWLLQNLEETNDVLFES